MWWGKERIEITDLRLRSKLQFYDKHYDNVRLPMFCVAA